MKHPLLFVAAEPRECRPFVAHWDRSERVALPVHWARQGSWRGREVLAIANGAGAERARAAVQAAPTAAAVCNIGFCGALADSLAPGDIFVAVSVHGGGRTWLARRPGGPAVASAASGALVSVDRIAQTAGEKRELARTGASAVEMEAAGAAGASDNLKIPFYCVRAVSDRSDEDFANDFNRCLMPDGRISIARLVLGALSSPVRRFGELIRLSRRTALASHNLGEFLANCSF
jgi:adenosylhomocysteine nucleosidase